MAPQAHLSDDGPGAAIPFSLEGERGRVLYGQRWEPLSPPKGRALPPVVIVHGFGEHIGRYEALGHSLAGSGRPVWGMDLAGFGRSDGPRAVVEDLAGAIADIGRLVAAAAGHGLGDKATAPPARAQHPFLFGQSMGGAFAAAYAIEHPGNLSGLVLCAPAVHLVERPAWQSIGGRALAKMAPRAGVGRVVPAQLSRDTMAVSQYSADPLVWHSTVPARTAVEMLKAGRLVMKHAGELRLPLLIVHGEADQIVPVAMSRSLYREAGSTDKQLRVFRGLLHEPFNEMGKQEVVAVLLEWLGLH